MKDERPLYNSFALLRNVASMVALMQRLENRQYGLPGMATYYGPSGFGKTTAAVYAANKFQAILVEVKSAWRAKRLCEAILSELGIRPKPTVAYMVDQIAEALARTQRPLIIDEADHLVGNRIVPIVRDIHDGSGATVILIGEEEMPQKLRTWERVHGRMLDWVGAEAADLEDTRRLAEIYCPGVVLDTQVMEQLRVASAGSVRRISVNLAQVREFALTRGLKRLTAGDYEPGRFFTGEAPLARRAF